MENHNQQQEKENINVSKSRGAQEKGNFLPFKYAANILITRLRSLWPGSKDGRCVSLANRGFSASPGHECYKKMLRMVLRVLKATWL